ncbi:hypothetical protein AAA145_20550, partial [Phocaeicola dorei]
LSANSVMRGRLDARRTLKSLVADLRLKKKNSIFLGIFVTKLKLYLQTINLKAISLLHQF